jgi:hypothetical protein
MRLGGLAVAAVLLLAWTGGSTAFPLIPSQASISLPSQDSIEAVRWRHRHRGYAWAKQGDDTGGTARDFTAEDPSATPEAAPPDLGRRYQRGRFWSGRRDANRDQTGGLALTGANRLSPSDVVRPDPRRRRGWVDPPPAQ